MLVADGFWEIKNLNDTIAVVGLLLTIGSIWFSWYLARRDLEARIARAQKETVDRVVSALLQTDLSETLRSLQPVRELCRAKQWDRAMDRCEQAMHRIPRFRALPGLTADEAIQLDRIVDQLRLLIRQIEAIIDPAVERTELTTAKFKDLDNMITFLVAIEGRIRAAGLR